MESLAAVGKIFRDAALFEKEDTSLINDFRVGMVIAFTLKLLRKGVSMITSIANAGSYLRPAQAYPSRTTLTPADALPVAGADASAAAGNAKPGIPVSAVKALDISGLKAVSIKDIPELRDRMATNWLGTQAANAAAATDVPDNAPQNIYATVKVNGKIVATLYNGGSSVMTNDAAAKVGDLQDPPGLNGGPDLAQSACGAYREGRGRHSREGTHRDRAVRMEATSDGLDRLYPRAIGRGLRCDDGRRTEGYRAALCGISNSARALRRVYRL